MAQYKDEKLEADGPSDHELQLKATLHYGIGEACEYAGGKEIIFSKEFICGLTELTSKMIKLVSFDLEKFSRHAKRSTINVEDVKLYARRNESLLEYLTREALNLQQLKLSSKNAK